MKTVTYLSVLSKQPEMKGQVSAKKDSGAG